jgi:carboxymethylenebutenolidase
MCKRNRLDRCKQLVIVYGIVGTFAPLSACEDQADPQAPQAPAAAAAPSAPTAPPAPADPSSPPPAPEPQPPALPRPAATLSVAADDPAVQASQVSYPGAAGPLSAYLARPRRAGEYPAVIVIHDDRGLTDHIRDVARRLAKASFIALAPDLTSRAGSTGPLDPGRAQVFLASASPEDLLADLDAGLSFLRAQPGRLPGDSFGVLGFQMGGGYALRLSGRNAKITATVAYYGPAPLPIDPLKNTEAAILAHYAEMDDSANSGRAALQMVLGQAGKIFMARVHPGTRAAFNDDTGDSYSEGAAVAAWSDTLAWLEQFLGL